MAIFLLDQDLTTSTQQLDDQCLRWQIRETSEILSNIHHAISDNNPPRKANFIVTKHTLPTRWALWGMKYKQNYMFLCDLLNAGLDEHILRFHDLPNSKLPNISQSKKVWSSHFQSAKWYQENVPHNIPDIEPDKFGLEIIIPRVFKLTGISCNPSHPFIYDTYKAYYNYRNSEQLDCKECLNHKRDDGIIDYLCSKCDNTGQILKFNLVWTKRDKPNWIRQDFRPPKSKEE